MEKQDNTTAEQILTKFYGTAPNNSPESENLIELVNFVLTSAVPVQEQSKQEVTGKTWDDILTDFVCEHDQIKPYTLLQKWLEKNYNHLLSLPQEQKDKVTGVSDAQIEVLLEELEINCSECYNPATTDEESREIGKKATAIFISKLRSLLSSKAVEQKEPDGWITKDESMYFDKHIPDSVLEANGCSRNQLKPVYFSPIQEAEHKQGVTDKVNRVEIIDGSGRRYARYSIDLLQLDYQDDGKTLKLFVDTPNLRSLFGEKGKEKTEESIKQKLNRLCQKTGCNGKEGKDE